LSTTNDFPDDLGEPPSFPENEIDSSHLPVAGISLTRQALQDITHRTPDFVLAEDDTETGYETGKDASLLVWLNGVIDGEYSMKHQLGFDSLNVHGDSRGGGGSEAAEEARRRRKRGGGGSEAAEERYLLNQILPKHNLR